MVGTVCVMPCLGGVESNTADDGAVTEGKLAKSSCTGEFGQRRPHSPLANLAGRALMTREGGPETRERQHLLMSIRRALLLKKSEPRIG